MLNRLISFRSLPALAALLLLPAASAAQMSRLGLSMGEYTTSTSPFLYSGGFPGYGFDLASSYSRPGLGFYSPYWGGTFSPYYFSPSYSWTGWDARWTSPGDTVPGYRYGTLATTAQGRAAKRANFEVRLPAADARLWVEGVETRTKGRLRQFVSPPLRPGGEYTYRLRARWTEKGRLVTRTRTVTFRAGGRVRVDFTKQK
jgi:uncharacterized protein (TIGR03000 family)